MKVVHLLAALGLLITGAIGKNVLSEASNESVQIEENTFYLLCYKRDLKCIDAETEMLAGRNELLSDPTYSMISKDLIPQVKLVECIAGKNQEMCKLFKHNLHELMPPRVKIVTTAVVAVHGGEPSVYEYTSPIRREFILRKLMKFTVPVSVIPYR